MANVRISGFTGGAYANMKDIIESELKRGAPVVPVAEDARVSELKARLDRLQLQFGELSELASTPVEQAYENTINDLIGDARYILDRVTTLTADNAQAVAESEQLKDVLRNVSIRGLDELICWCRARHIGSDYKPQHDPECANARAVLGANDLACRAAGESAVLDFEQWTLRWCADNGRKMSQTEYGIAMTAFYSAHHVRRRKRNQEKRLVGRRIEWHSLPLRNPRR